MGNHTAAVFSNQHGITARVCSRGRVVLSLGRTSLSLWRPDFLRLARVVHAAVPQLAGPRKGQPSERSH
jgi:hypothetical protein